MELDDNIMQTRTVGQIVSVIQSALDDMHPHSYGFQRFEEIINKRKKAMDLLNSYAVNKGMLRSTEL